MTAPRVLGNGCLSCTAFCIESVEDSLQDVMAFLQSVGDAHRDGFSVTCLVEHPDHLVCHFKAEAFKLVDGTYVMEFRRMRGDSLLFGLLLRDHRDYLSTGMLPILFPGELIPRCRFGPTSEPQLDIPPLIL